MFNLLKTLPLPVAREVFLKPQKMPYLIYRTSDCTITAANSKNVGVRQNITLELYTDLKNTELNQNKVEKLLDSFTTYSKSESYISEQKLYITYYKFDIGG